MILILISKNSISSIFVLFLIIVLVTCHTPQSNKIISIDAHPSLCEWHAVEVPDGAVLCFNPSSLSPDELSFMPYIQFHVGGIIFRGGVAHFFLDTIRFSHRQIRAR